MRTYHQYCALARALDVIGERWTLLIIRELFARDARYSDLRDALPGIATNLLAERLRHLQQHAIIETYAAPAPVRATCYRLTARGRDLGPVLSALVSWGTPLLATQGDDEFRTHWMALGLPTFFDGVDVSDLAPFDVVVRTGDEPATLSVTSDGVTMTAGEPLAEAAVTVEGEPEHVLAFLTGQSSPEGGDQVTVTGPSEDVQRVHALALRARA